MPGTGSRSASGRFTRSNQPLLPETDREMTLANPGGPPARRTPTESGALPAWGGGVWFRGAEARAGDEPGLVCALGRQLHGAGLGFDRLVFHVGTLHPEI